MAKYFYIDQKEKDAFIKELLGHDCILESDIDEISNNFMMVYCDVSEDFEHLAFDLHSRKRVTSLIRVVFDAEGY